MTDKSIQDNIDEQTTIKNRDSIANLKEDISNVKKQPPDSKRSFVISFIQRNKFLISAIVALITVVALWFITIPEWVYVTLLAILLFTMVGYMPMKKLSKRFIKDRRVPIVVIPDELDAHMDLKVPRDIIEQVRQDDDVTPYRLAVLTEDFDNEKIWKVGYQFSRFKIKSQEGEQVIEAETNWQGTMSNYQLQKNKKNLEIMRENLQDKAKRWEHFKMNKDLMIVEMASVVINIYAQKFEGVVNDEDIVEEFKEIVDMESIENAVNEAENGNVDEATEIAFENIDDDDIEQLQEIAKGGKNE